MRITQLLLNIGTYLGLVKWTVSDPQDRHVRHFRSMENRVKEAKAKELSDNYKRIMDNAYSQKDWYNAEEYVERFHYEDV